MQMAPPPQHMCWRILTSRSVCYPAWQHASISCNCENHPPKWKALQPTGFQKLRCALTFYLHEVSCFVELVVVGSFTLDDISPCVPPLVKILVCSYFHFVLSPGHSHYADCTHRMRLWTQLWNVIQSFTPSHFLSVFFYDVQKTPIKTQHVLKYY